MHARAAKAGLVAGKKLTGDGVVFVMKGSLRVVRAPRWVWLLLFAAFLTACGESFTQERTENAFDPNLPDPTEIQRSGANGPLPGLAPGDAPVPEGYFRSFDRDQIEPVYEPTFVGADGVSWPDDEVVIGVNINGQQRAYPVGFLSNRELVIDEIDDIPILVSW